jgi:hypothetical protein
MPENKETKPLRDKVIEAHRRILTRNNYTVEERKLKKKGEQMIVEIWKSPSGHRLSTADACVRAMELIKMQERPRKIVMFEEDTGPRF